MNYFYDLHLHSCLSPCGDEQMTPNNIANMAKLLGLDVIALTDHNTAKNAEAVMKVGEKIGLTVIPGMELTTSEDIHAVCLFPTLEAAMAFDSFVEEKRIKIMNRPEIYGEQLIMDENDEVIGEIEHLLLPSSNIGIARAYQTVKDFGGICYPAHIDRDSLSILSVLGEIDPSCGFKTAEIFDFSTRDKLMLQHPILSGMHLISCSDAHYLENMREASLSFELDQLSSDAVLSLLDS